MANYDRDSLFGDVKTNNEIGDDLFTEIQSNGKTSESTERRKKNIEFIKDLNRDGLKHGDREKQIKVHETRRGEEIFIQYPGKESQNSGDRKRPWDFRPKMVKPSGEYFADMSFVDIWASFFENILPICLSENERGREAVRFLAVYIYRMTYLLEHRFLVSPIKLPVRTVFIDDGKETYSDYREEKFEGFYLYEPNYRIIDEIYGQISDLTGMSIEGFLCYNDFLAWNEDCKYYYRNYVNRDKNRWLGKTGRVNNLLTHVNVLACFLGDVEWAKLLGRLQRGVAAVTQKEMRTIGKGLVE